MRSSINENLHEKARLRLGKYAAYGKLATAGAGAKREAAGVLKLDRAKRSIRSFVCVESVGKYAFASAERIPQEP